MSQRPLAANRRRSTIAAATALLVLVGGGSAQASTSHAGHRQKARKAAHAAHRSAARWPLAATSIWNTPVGSTARYTAFYATTDDHGGRASAPGIQGPGIALSPTGAVRTGSGVNAGLDVSWIYTAKASDPLVTVHQQQAWGPGRCASATTAHTSGADLTPLRLHLPDAVVIPDASGGATPNNSAAIIQPDGTVAQFNVAARCSAGADDFTATPAWQLNPLDPASAHADAQLTGAGTYGGHGGSGLSALGGTLTAADITSRAPIHHALSLDINAAEYLYDDGTSGHVWPAPTQDAAATSADYYGGYHGRTPALRMGALLAVPPRVTAASLGLSTALGAKLFHALQDYGSYVVDDTGWSSVDLNVDQHADAAATATYGYSVSGGKPGSPWGADNPAYYRDLMSIYAHLEVISNNSASSVGGGGRHHRAAPAPSFG